MIIKPFRYILVQGFTMTLTSTSPTSTTSQMATPAAPAWASGHRVPIAAPSIPEAVAKAQPG